MIQNIVLINGKKINVNGIVLCRITNETCRIRYSKYQYVNVPYCENISVPQFMFIDNNNRCDYAVGSNEDNNKIVAGIIMTLIVMFFIFIIIVLYLIEYWSCLI
jgi:hypothetical protein